ncbi:MAG: hypothetical protein ACI9XO_004978 [Paraglaciecola sp.]|jgi:hypothetical protein
MTEEKLDETIRREAQGVKGKLGNWTMEYGKTPLVIISHAEANRMRIFAPVIEAKEMKCGEMEKMLEANFHSALDAKYCLYEGMVISVFTHPLKELTEEQLVDAMRQVVLLSATYGTTYSSTDLIFGGGFKGKKAPKVSESPTKIGLKN